MRTPSHGSQRSATATLLIVLVGAFILQSVLEFYRIFPVTEYLALSVHGLARGFVWQLLTYQFLHDGLLHLVFNGIVIYFFGQAIEEMLGRRGFLKLYLASGVIGGFLQMVGAWLIPSHFGGAVIDGAVVGGAVVGASAGAFGLVAAFATVYPERQLTLLVFFVIPVNMKARTLLWISMGLAIFGLVVPYGNIAHAAHLGGILTGLAYVHWFVRGRGWRLTWAGQSSRPSRPDRDAVPVQKPAASYWKYPTRRDEVDDAEFISKEVDPILDKIAAHGIQSLTDRERQILEKARAKMAKR